VGAAKLQTLQVALERHHPCKAQQAATATFQVQQQTVVAVAAAQVLQVERPVAEFQVQAVTVYQTTSQVQALFTLAAAQVQQTNFLR
jgi:hypothetical protein